MTEKKDVDKLNGATDAQIAGYVSELDNLNYINPSTDPKKRKNLPEERGTKVNKAQVGLEGILAKTAGGETAIIANKDTVDNIAYALIGDVTKLPDAKENPAGREQAYQDFLAQAGVNYEALVRRTVGLMGGVKIDQLPEDHPLRILVSYIAGKKVKDEERARFLQQQIVRVGALKAPAVADALNKVAGTNLDTRVATPQEALAAYGAKLQARTAKYRATDPNVVYNRKAA